MRHLETTHRLAEDGALALCGDDAPCASTEDAAVTCPTCRALIALQAMRRRTLILRSVVVIAPLATA
jgi:hypothetical protein